MKANTVPLGVSYYWADVKFTYLKIIIKSCIKRFFSSANSDHVIVARSIFENPRIASRIRENCQNQLAMSVMGMHDLVHTVCSSFLIVWKGKGLILEYWILIFKEQGRKGEEQQKTFNGVIMDTKKKSRSRKIIDMFLEIGIFLDLTYCNSLETFLQVISAEWWSRNLNTETKEIRKWIQSTYF